MRYFLNLKLKYSKLICRSEIASKCIFHNFFRQNVSKMNTRDEFQSKIQITALKIQPASLLTMLIRAKKKSEREHRTLNAPSLNKFSSYVHIGSTKTKFPYLCRFFFFRNNIRAAERRLRAFCEFSHAWKRGKFYKGARLYRVGDKSRPEESGVDRDVATFSPLGWGN